MDEIPISHLKHLELRLGQLAYRLARLKVSSFPAPQGWCPPINAYHGDEELVVCVDLAGVDRSAIDLRVEPTRILLRGYRLPPAPKCSPDGSLRIVSMEIDHGPFEREIPLPVPVQSKRVRAEHKQGILWIRLPVERNDPEDSNHFHL